MDNFENFEFGSNATNFCGLDAKYQKDIGDNSTLRPLPHDYIT